MYLVIREGMSFVTSLLVLGITSLILKKNWYDKMNADEAEYERLVKELDLHDKP